MSKPPVGPLQSSPVITRCPLIPLIAPADVPYGPSLTYNAGVIKYQGRYVMVFRNDYIPPNAPPGQFDVNVADLGLAFSDDGLHWDIQPQPCWAYRSEEVRRVYDPRLMLVDSRVHVTVALDTPHGIRTGIAVTDDFYHYEMLSTTTPDNRNMVLFPRRFDGRYVRLERPFPAYSRGGDYFDIWASDSPDLKYWGNPRLVLGTESVPFCNDKIGPGAQPIETDRGWLLIFHAVDVDPARGKNGWEDRWTKRYTMAVMLTALDDPARVIGLYKKPLMVPEAPYETEGGLRNNVLFPGGVVLEDDGEVKIYYGAADTTECLATAPLDDLLKLCLEG